MGISDANGPFWYGWPWPYPWSQGDISVFRDSWDVWCGCPL